MGRSHLLLTQMAKQEFGSKTNITIRESPSTEWACEWWQILEQRLSPFQQRMRERLALTLNPCSSRVKRIPQMELCELHLSRCRKSLLKGLYCVTFVPL